VCTATGGTGIGYAQPNLSVSGDSFFGVSLAGASASFAGCELSAGGEGPPEYCPWSSLQFTFGVPQTLTLSLYADASGGILPGPVVVSDAMFLGFSFWSGYQQSLAADYTLTITGEPAPEPGTFLLAAIACAAGSIFAIARRPA
jgi:hypothetical protein